MGDTLSPLFMVVFNTCVFLGPAFTALATFHRSHSSVGEGSVRPQLALGLGERYSALPFCNVFGEHSAVVGMLTATGALACII